MKRTIKKVLEELQKEKPDLSYIRGMLEVLVDEEEPKVVSSSVISPKLVELNKINDQPPAPPVVSIGRISV